MPTLNDIGEQLKEIDKKCDTIQADCHKLRMDFEIHKAVVNEQPKITGKQMTFITAVAGAIGAALSKIAGFFAS